MIEENGLYYESCGDCGGAVKDHIAGHRKDICNDCWGRRGWLVANMKTLPLDRIREVQKSMSYHRGTAKKKILKLMADFVSLPDKQEQPK